MTLSSRFILTLVLAAAGSAVAQQQWGPPAQSKLYHDPAHTPTYTAYNTATPTQHMTAPTPAVSPRPAATVAKPVVRRHVAPHRTTSTTQY